MTKAPTGIIKRLRARYDPATASDQMIMKQLKQQRNRLTDFISVTSSHLGSPSKQFSELRIDYVGSEAMSVEAYAAHIDALTGLSQTQKLVLQADRSLLEVDMATAEFYLDEHTRRGRAYLQSDFHCRFVTGFKGQVTK